MTDRTPGPVEVVDPRTAARLMADGAVVVDVRERTEWDAGHVEGATFVPLGTLEERAAELPVDLRIVVVCRSGGRSEAATRYLVALGCDAVNLEGGLQAWAAVGLPLTSPSGGPGRVA